jgi:hypothetical protein
MGQKARINLHWCGACGGNRGVLRGTFVLTVLMMLSTNAWGQNDWVRLEGLVPQNINSKVVADDYARISQTLAPDIPVDRSPLTVTYFTKRADQSLQYWLPEWGGGGALGADQIIVAVDGAGFPHNDLYQTTLHELTHIAIRRIVDTVAVPRWFHEGAALQLSGELSFREQVVLSRAIFSGSLMDLRAIDTINSAGPYRARLAYAQSHQAIRFLIETYGFESLALVVQATRRTGSFRDALQQVVGITVDEMNSLTLQFLRQRFGTIAWLADTYLLWSGIAVLFLIAYVVTLIRRRLQAVAMEREEQFEEERGDRL